MRGHAITNTASDAGRREAWMDWAAVMAVQAWQDGRGPTVVVGEGAAEQVAEVRRRLARMFGNEIAAAMIEARS